jgi:hypothetical protein
VEVDEEFFQKKELNIELQWIRACSRGDLDTAQRLLSEKVTFYVNHLHILFSR